MNLSTGQVKAFFESSVWTEIKERLDGYLLAADGAIERPDPFEHGRAVGERTAYRTVLAFEKALMAESKGESPYGNRR